VVGEIKLFACIKKRKEKNITSLLGGKKDRK
jgi:hypothetical protein